MPENIVVGLKSRNAKTRKELQDIVSALPGFRSQEFDFDSPCDLLILELEGNPPKEIPSIDKFQESGLAKEVFLTSSFLEPELLLRAIRAGAKEFFTQPIQRTEVEASLLKFQERIKRKENQYANKGKNGKIINVIGSKGGVGTTTLSVNIATNLAQNPFGSVSVILVDLNLLFGEIPIFLDVQNEFNWAEVARNINRLDSHYLMSILSKHGTGLYVLPSPTGLEGFNIATPEIMERILEQMRAIFDFIVIDSGQSLDEVSLKILHMSDFVLLTAILSLPCLTNVKRLLYNFERLGFPDPEGVKIIINRYHKKSLISIKEAEEVLKRKVFRHIENDFINTMAAINQGKPLQQVAPNSEVMKNIRELAFTFIAKKKIN
jgi:pilus assembly protein CpaE